MDYYVQKNIPSIPIQIRNSGELVDKLKKLKLNSSDIWLTISDAKSMYSNIDPEEGINTIQKYVDRFAGEFKGHFPTTLILKLLRLALETNMFKFGNTWWKQII